MQGLIRDRQVEDNRLAFGDGAGVLAVTTSAGGATPTITTTNPMGITNPGPGGQYIRPGMLIGFVNPSLAFALKTDGAGTQAWEVLNVNGATGAITFTTNIPAAVVVGDLMVRVSWADVAVTDRGSTSYLNEPFGLAAIVSDDNPYGHTGVTAIPHNLGEIDATTNQIWQAAVVQNSGTPRPFHQGLFDQGNDAVDITGDGQVSLWMTSHGIRRQYLHDMISNKRYVGTVEVADGSFKAVEHNGLPIIVDKDCTRGRIYGLDPSSLMMFTETDYFWMDGDNSVLQRDPDRDQYHATLVRYCENGTDKRNANVLIKDIQDS